MSRNKFMYEHDRDVNRKKEATKKANQDCRFQQTQKVERLREYGYLLKHENVFLAEEEVQQCFAWIQAECGW